MCILLELNFEKFGVSNLFVSKVIGEKPLGGRPPGTGRVKNQFLERGEYSLIKNIYPTTARH